MAKHIQIPPFKLSRPQKKLLGDFLIGKGKLTETADALGVSTTRLYIMCTALTRHASTAGRINIEEILKDY